MRAIDNGVFTDFPEVNIAIFVLIEQSLVDADVTTPNILSLCPSHSVSLQRAMRWIFNEPVDFVVDKALESQRQSLVGCQERRSGNYPKLCHL